jgi:hypothetical protein
MKMDITRVHMSSIRRMSETRQCNGAMYQLFVRIQERLFQLEVWFSITVSLRFYSCEST